jgi:putative oxidoreductase
MGLIFLVSGVGMLMNMGVSGVAGMIAKNGVPLASLCAVILLAMKIGGGAALMLGYRSGLAAGVLILFTLIATWFGHVNVEPFDQVGTLKNLAIVGGLLYVIAYGPGQGWKLVK